MKTVGVRFRRARKAYTFAAGELEIKKGDRVVVETERGMAMGLVTETASEAPESPVPVKPILRVAEPRDVERLRANEETEKDAGRVCADMIREKQLPMKLLDVECLFDRSKLIFCFASENRVDFRELVRDLARHFHTRIEMRQVGVRDEAKMIGGVGACGRELCCATWLADFLPISVRMAKSQNISLNPAKISGICGRLMCCLAYENKMYEDLSKGMPKVGKKVSTPKGEGRVLRRNALEGTFSVLTEAGEVEIGVEEYAVFKEEHKDDPVKPAEPRAPEARPAEPRAGRGPRDASRSEPRRAPPPKPAPPPEVAPVKAREEGDGEEGEEFEEGIVEGEGAATGEPGAPQGEGERKPSRRRRRRKRKPSQSREPSGNA